MTEQEKLGRAIETYHKMFPELRASEIHDRIINGELKVSAVVANLNGNGGIHT